MGKHRVGTFYFDPMVQYGETSCGHILFRLTSSTGFTLIMHPFDINSCWSGSATILPGNKPVILYTGEDANKRQVQNLVIPKNLCGPLLKEWIKIPQNPLMSPINGINSSNFRDPITAWLGLNGKWRIIVGSARGKHEGMALLYWSKDFLHWNKSEHPLHSSPKTRMWECPDFFPVSRNSTNGVDTSVNDTTVKHILKASYDSYDYYTLGWSGLQLIPRKIWLSRTERQLLQWPIKEIETLRENRVNLQKKDLASASVFKISGIKASQADVEVSFELPKLEEAELMDPRWVDPKLLCSEKGASIQGQAGPFGLLVLAFKDLEEQTAIFFGIFKENNRYVVLMCSDQAHLEEQVIIDGIKREWRHFDKVTDTSYNPYFGDGKLYGFDFGRLGRTD
ncbi:hypothetical protein GIB67_041625 [Kingdonia uniflora]|uniref:Uncharacterized protein n=1 Tax=Kingdonia uniflora TaxID=39325 RepID=A0A7J7MQP8_9MAGN|nr:hypothetical protein GIB67_041625 [Kingdonia uniflora]